MTSSRPVLEVRDLRVTFDSEDGTVRAVDGVDFSVAGGESLAIVGESGCGKTTVALAVMGLLPKPAGKVESGEILLDGDNVITMPRDMLRRARGERMAMIFQDALTALNPVHKVGYQIAEAIRAHRDVNRSDAWAQAVDLLTLVGIPSAADRASDYVHQFSGGMRQRAMIAMAVALDPVLLIADEPTTALDVTVQAQVLEVLADVRERFNTSLILITHDLGVVARMADRVMVMYAGRKVEEAPIDTLYGSPRHPYTWALLRSVPRLDSTRGRLVSIGGSPPDLISPPPACRFEPRCPFAQDICREEDPELRVAGRQSQHAACHFADRPDWPRILAEAEPALAGEPDAARTGS